MASVTVRTEQVDGFETTVMANETKGTTFRVWKLGEFKSFGAKPVEITSVTGENGSAKAAAYNLANRNDSFLSSMLRRRVQWGNRVVTIPGAQVQCHGYDSPVSLTLSEQIASPKAARFAVAAMADTVANVVARGVYALINQADGETPEAAESLEDVESIEF